MNNKKIFGKSKRYGNELSVNNFINKTLNYDNEQIGELESMRNRLYRLQGSYTRLLEELHRSKVLTDEQVYYIVRGVEYNEDY